MSAHYGKQMIKYRVRAQARELLAERNLSQRWLARRTGLSSGYVCQLLSGKRCPGPEVRRLLLGVPPFEGMSFEELFVRVSDEAAA